MPRLNRLGLSCLLLIYAATVFSQDLVEAIRIQGNRRVAEESIRFRISQKVDEPLDPARITQDLKTLWNTGLFDNVGAAVSDGQTGRIITFVIRELPLITEVDFRGNKKVTKSSITDKIEEEHLSIPEETPLDYRKINAIRTLIRELLLDRGLRYGTVDYKLEYLDSGAARVVFNISEGSKVRIREIDFTGNNIFTDKRLRKTMRKTKENWFLSWVTSDSIYKEERFEEDVERLKKRYWKKGHKDIFIGEPLLEITDHTSEKQKRKNARRAAKNRPIKEDIRLKLTIPVYEGRPYYLGDFAIEGNTVLKTEVYELFFPLKEGDVYDLGKINEWIEDFEKTHNNLGYINYSVEQDFSIRDDNIVDVSFSIKENDQIYVHRIGFSGNITTRDKVLRREILLREGDVFRLNHFRNSLLRVNQLAFFDVSRDEPDVKFLPGENKVNVTVKGQEAGVNELNFGLGFSEFRGSSGFLSFSTLNFLGKGEKLKAQVQLGSITDTFDITFTEPWLFDKPRGLTTRIFNTRTNFSTAGFDLESTGFQLGLSFRPTIFTSYAVSYNFSEDRFPVITSPAFKPVDDLLTSSIIQTIAYNTTDHPFFPTRGRKASLTFDVASWQAGGDNFFYKVQLKGTQYFQSVKDTFFAINLNGAILNTLEGQRPTQSQLFFLGGEESIRGYRRRSLGPSILDTTGNPIATLGDKLFQANFEYIIPVSDQLRFVLFYDAGMIFGVDEDWFETDLARSTGVEMRFSLPIFQAPLRLIYAFKLDENALNDKGAEPRFSIGTTF